MTARQHFSHDEAEAKLGQVVWTCLSRRRIAKGMRGTVLYARQARDGYELGIQWALTPALLTFTVLPRFPFIGLRRGPIADWVRKDQYARYLTEADEVAEGDRQEGTP